MSKDIAELKTRFNKLGNLHSRRLANTKKAILMLVRALAPHLSTEDQAEIKKLFGNG